MRTAYKVIFSAYLLSTSACTTLNESMQLGGALGAASGAAATYSAYRSVDKTPSFENVASGAAIGLGVGLLTSYLVHGKVEEDRKIQFGDKTEVYFGDLPPSPFVFPVQQSKGGR